MAETVGGSLRLRHRRQIRLHLLTRRARVKSVVARHGIVVLQIRDAVVSNCVVHGGGNSGDPLGQLRVGRWGRVDPGVGFPGDSDAVDHVVPYCLEVAKPIERVASDAALCGWVGFRMFVATNDTLERGRLAGAVPVEVAAPVVGVAIVGCDVPPHVAPVERVRIGAKDEGHQFPHLDFHFGVQKRECVERARRVEVQKNPDRFQVCVETAHEVLIWERCFCLVELRYRDSSCSYSARYASACTVSVYSASTTARHVCPIWLRLSLSERAASMAS